MKPRFLSMLIASSDPSLVERSAPGAAPSAFRLWAAGENMTDDGPVIFTQKSASVVMAEQDARGRLYPFDFDHLSLKSDRPAESGRAAGWHRIEVRDGALWAVDIDWCEDAKAGLEADPPHWRYFSPAFRTKGEEITSYINCALCINPLTHQLPSLASESAATKGQPMNKMLAHIATLADSNASEDDKKSALKALGEFFQEGDKDKGDDKPKDEPKKDAEPPCGDDKPKDEPKKDAEPAEEEKTETKAIASIERRLSAYDKLVERVSKQDADERTRMLAARPDLTDGMRKELAAKPLEEVTRLLSFMPAPAAKLNGRATQGEGDVDGDAARPGLEGAELEEYNRLAGKRPPVTKAFERMADGALRMNAVTPTDWHRLNAKKDGK